MGLFGKKKTPAEILAEGKAQYRKGEYEKAVLILLKASGKENGEVDYWIGRCYLASDQENHGNLKMPKKFLTYAAKAGHADAAKLLAEQFGIRDYLPPEQENPAPQDDGDDPDEEKAFRESMQVIDMLEQGEQALFEEEYEEAISCYEWVLAHTDDNDDFCDQAREGIVQAKEFKERREEIAQLWQSLSSKAEAPAEKPVSEMSAEEIYQKGMDLYYAGDNKKALSLFEKAAQQGNADAQYMMCKMYKNGIGTEEDPIEAFRWLKKAAAQGEAAALLELVEMADDYWEYDYWADDYEEAFSLFQKAAVQEGHVEAQYICGQICDGQYFGTEIEPDLSQCVMWYEEAAAQEHEKSVEELKKWEKYVRMTPEQQYRAGNEAYDNKEYVLAFMLVKEAARQVADAADVFFFLGEMYRDGCGTKTDCEKAYFWWEKAARLGNAAAQCECGEACYYGDGVEKNQKKARMWYEKAAAQTGDEEAREEAQWALQKYF